MPPITLARPTNEDIIDGLIRAVVTDLQSPNSLILSVLPEGVTVPLTESKNEGSAPGAVRYTHVKFGVRGKYPDDLAFSFFPVQKRNRWETTPGGLLAQWTVILRTTYRATKVFLNEDVINRMFCVLPEVLEYLLGPENLTSDGASAWDVLGMGREEEMVMDPFVSLQQLTPWEDKPDVQTHKFNYFSDLVWMGYRERVVFPGV